MSSRQTDTAGVQLRPSRRWENSRLRLRMPLSSLPSISEGSDNESRAGGGVPLSLRGGSEMAANGCRERQTVERAFVTPSSPGNGMPTNGLPTSHVGNFSASMYNRNPSFVVYGAEGAAFTAMPNQVNNQLTTPPGSNGFHQEMTAGAPHQGMYNASPLAGHSASSSSSSTMPHGPMVSPIQHQNMPTSIFGAGMPPYNNGFLMGNHQLPNYMPVPTTSPMPFAGGITGLYQQTQSQEEGREFLKQFLLAKSAQTSPTPNAGQKNVGRRAPGPDFTNPQVLGQGQQTGAVQQHISTHGTPSPMDGAGDPPVATQHPSLQLNSQHVPKRVNPKMINELLGNTPANARQMPWNPSNPANGITSNVTGSPQAAPVTGIQSSHSSASSVGHVSVIGTGSPINNNLPQAAGPVIQQPQNGFVLHVGGGPNHLGPLEFTPVPEEVRANRSAWLNELTGPDGKPDLLVLTNPANIPFVEPWSLMQRPTTGVVCISNIPYDVTRAEILAFLGRSAKIPSDRFEPVHIIMDRTTSKTNDCYVEFNTLQDAVNAVNKHQTAIDNGRHPRIGKRTVDITLSSAGKLMKELFPFAKGFVTTSTWPWENFKSFVTKEEMISLCKHAECPNHSPFALNCPERVFECLISTLKKMPWYVSDRVTIKERGYIYAATEKMIGILMSRIQKGDKSNRLTPQLLDRLSNAAMSCAGFSVMQKDNIAWLIKLPAYKLRDFQMPPHAHSWTHLHALSIKPGVPHDVVEYYIALIREETNRIVDRLSVRRQAELQKQQAATSDYWGFFWKEIIYPPVGPAFDNLTLDDLAGLEWAAIDRCLRRALQGGSIPPQFSQ
ncbi:hypothetical protein F5Y13DRAFT_185255 [Hypoxylon sp. FL1857]|nr:hypothetical protein F5Y13DRAFT_185255 [Hypoxylon sp. FL1857]